MKEKRNAEKENSLHRVLNSRAGIQLIPIILILTFIPFGISAQEKDEQDQKIRLSGIVLRLDSLTPIPSANVYIQRTYTGVQSNEMGLFSLEVERNDTIVFSAVGSKTSYYIVPKDLEGKSYSIIQSMPIDTVYLKTVEISSWPSLEQFNAAFTKEFGYDQKFISAYKNSNPDLSKVDLREIKMDESANFRREGLRYANRYSYIYENAHIPIRNVMNPQRWDKLVTDWKTGKHPR